MPLTPVHGTITDVLESPMRDRMVRLWWQLNEPSTTANAGPFATDRVYATISPNSPTGTWAISIEDTESMAQTDRWYTVGWDWLDADGNFIDEDRYPAKVYVPKSDTSIPFGRLARDWTHPLAVVISETQPKVREQWWLDPSTGRLYVKKEV